ncbi:MAG TPA: hypothetical protein PLQ81_03465 [bacterium]|nr:hypothetical protein [bacterium]
MFTVLIIGVIITIPLIAVMMRTPIIYKSYILKRNKLISRSIAESGLSDAFHRWKNDFEWESKTNISPELKVKFGNFYYKILSERILFPERIKIKSTGFGSGNFSSVEQEFCVQSPILYSLFSDGEILLDGKTEVSGHIKSNDIINIGESVIINGNIITSKFVKNYNPNISDNIFERRDFFEFKFPDLKDIAEYDSLTFIPEYRLDNSHFENKIIFVNNGLDASNCNFVNCALIVNGNLEFAGNIGFKASGNFPFIIAAGNITVKGASNSIKAIILSNQNFYCADNLNLNGSIIARSIEITGNSYINYNKDYWSLNNEIFPKIFIKTNFTY